MSQIQNEDILDLAGLQALGASEADLLKVEQLSHAGEQVSVKLSATDTRIVNLKSRSNPDSYLVNGTSEAGLTGWTASGASLSLEEASPIKGVSSFKIDFSSSSQYVEIACSEIDPVDRSRKATLFFDYVQSGDANEIYIDVFTNDGSIDSLVHSERLISDSISFNLGGYANHFIRIRTTGVFSGSTTLLIDNLVLKADKSVEQEYLGDTAGNEMLVLQEDGTFTWEPIVEGEARITKPSITSPADGASNLNQSITLQGSSFTQVYGDPHLLTDWQIAYDQDFTNILHENLDSTQNLTSYSYTLPDGVTVYARCRYGDGVAKSSYSTPIQFSIIDIFITKPSVVSPNGFVTDLTPTLTGSSFAVTNGTDTHEATEFEVATDSGFSSMHWQSSTLGAVTSATVTTELSGGVDYYSRVRYKGVNQGWSDWSDPVQMTGTLRIENPSITSPTEGATSVSLTPTITASAYSQFYSDPHVHTDWQIATDSGFSNIVWESLADTSNLESITPSQLLDETLLYVRVRYNDGVENSAWSTPVSFTTINAYIATPAVSSPSGTVYDSTPTISASSFAPVNGSDTHSKSQFQVATDSGFSNIVWDSGEIAGTTSRTVTTTLSVGQQYYARARYEGTLFGWSSWSSASAFQCANPAPASGTQYVLTSGSSWTAPSPGTSYNVKVEVWGGGGGGTYTRGGGGGGYSLKNSQAVTGGTSYAYTIGAGGAGERYEQAPNGGTTSMFSISATGGTGGWETNDQYYAPGGSGVGGSINYTGGSGGYSNGGGGGAASETGNGGDGSSGGQDGFDGASGGGASVDSSSYYPGGGGGAGYDGGGVGTFYTGGAGTGINRNGASAGEAGQVWGDSGKIGASGGLGGGGGGGNITTSPEFIAGSGGRGLIIITVL